MSSAEPSWYADLPPTCAEVLPADDVRRGGPGLITPCILFLGHSGDHCSEVADIALIQKFRGAYSYVGLPTVVWPRLCGAEEEQDG